METTLYLIAVTSGKGGTGKSCVAAYVAAALAAKNKKTLLLELGATAPSLDIIVGAQEDTVFHLGDVVAGRCTVEEAIAPATISEQLYLLPAPPGTVDRDFHPDPRDVHTLLQNLRHVYDYIVLDGIDFQQVPPAWFDTILLVTTPDTLSVRACQECCQHLEKNGGTNIRLVINNVPSQVIPIYGADDFDDVINLIGAQLIAVLPHSPKLTYSSNHSKPLDPSSVTVQIFDNLVVRMRGQSRPLLIY